MLLSALVVQDVTDGVRGEILTMWVAASSGHCVITSLRHLGHCVIVSSLPFTSVLAVNSVAAYLGGDPTTV